MAGFLFVVDHHPDLRDLGIGAEVHLALLQEAGLERALDELAAPDTLDARGDAAAADHLGEARADDVVLEADVVLAVLGLLGGVALGGFEETRQARVKLDVPAAFEKLAVVQSPKLAGEHIREDVVQVADLAREMVAALAVVLHQRIGLGPERGLVDAEPTEERRLHVAGD